jgi:hypothetical protein
MQAGTTGLGNARKMYLPSTSGGVNGAWDGVRDATQRVWLHTIRLVHAASSQFGPSETMNASVLICSTTTMATAHGTRSPLHTINPLP